MKNIHEFYHVDINIRKCLFARTVRTNFILNTCTVRANFGLIKGWKVDDGDE